MSLRASPVYAEYLAGLAKMHTLPVVGIILGISRDNFPDRIVHMCRLFKSEEDGDEPVDEETRKDTLIYDVDDILHMMAPGVNVLGSFVVCKSEDVVKDPAWDRVKLLYRVIRKLCGGEKHYILVHNAQAAKAKQNSAKLVVGDKSNLDKNELKSISVDLADHNTYNFVQVDAQFAFSQSVFLRSHDWAEGERGQMKVTRVQESLCGDLENILNQAQITFNGEIPTANLKISDLVTRREDAGGDSSKLNPIVAEIYENHVSIREDENVKRSNDVIRLKGCVASRLFVYPEDSVAFVESLLRKDLIQSVQQRIQRATETDEGGKEGVVGLETLSSRMGRRIYFTIQPSNIQLFDYLYPDENEDQLRERINSKLDIDVEVTDIYFDLEEDGNDFGRESPLIKTIEQTVADTTKAAASQITSQLGNRKGLYLVIRFLLVAVLAIVIPLVFNNKKDK